MHVFCAINSVQYEHMSSHGLQPKTGNNTPKLGDQILSA
jgi:hypothetical protein